MTGSFTAPPGFWQSSVIPKLPPPGSRTLAGVALPEGEYIHPDGDATLPPIAYASVRPQSRREFAPLMSALVNVYPQTGLWPLRMGEDCSSEEAFSRACSVSEADVLDIYRQHHYPDDPYALPTVLIPGTDGFAPESDQCAAGGSGYLLLVPVEYPSQCAAALGWMGPVNEELFPPEISAVLRSWEQRWGITPTGLSLDWLELTIPQGRMAAVDRHEFVRELWCFCRESAEEYLESGYRSTQWTLYWD